MMRSFRAPRGIPSPLGAATLLLLLLSATGEVAAQDLARVAPFRDIVWEDDQPRILVGEGWFDWLAIDGIPTDTLEAASRSRWADLWQKRVAEDLVEVMALLGHAPSSTVELTVRDSAGVRVLEQVPMTTVDRQAVVRARRAREGIPPPPTRFPPPPPLTRATALEDLAYLRRPCRHGARENPHRRRMGCETPGSSAARRSPCSSCGGAVGCSRASWHTRSGTPSRPWSSSVGTEFEADPESPTTRFPMKSLTSASVVVFALTFAASGPVVGQESTASEIINLNRRIMQQQIIERDSDLFDQSSLEEFIVVAPGGRIENKTEALGGVNAWDAASIDVRDEQVVIHGPTAVLVGRLEIDGVMRPVGTLPPMKFMAVFVETGGEWKLLARSLTPCFEMAIQNGFC